MKLEFIMAILVCSVAIENRAFAEQGPTPVPLGEIAHDLPKSLLGSDLEKTYRNYKLQALRNINSVSLSVSYPLRPDLNKAIESLCAKRLMLVGMRVDPHETSLPRLVIFISSLPEGNTEMKTEVQLSLLDKVRRSLDPSTTFYTKTYRLEIPVSPAESEAALTQAVVSVSEDATSRFAADVCAARSLILDSRPRIQAR